MSAKSGKKSNPCRRNKSRKALLEKIVVDMRRKGIASNRNGDFITGLYI